MEFTFHPALTGVEVKTFLSNTLYDPEEIKKANGGKAPQSYKAFQSAAARMPPPPTPVDDAPEQLPPIDSKAKGSEEKATGVPSLKEVGFEDEKPTTPFHVSAWAACMQTVTACIWDVGHLLNQAG